MNYLIKDSYKLSLPEDKVQRDALRASYTEFKDSTGAPALEVVLDATHGGYVNANLTKYTKEGQQKAAKSWFTPFPKPVLVEHDDDKSAIGRVVDAQYVDIPVDQSQLLAAGKMGKPTSKITLKALITDPDAIQKVMDGRFLTVSISGRPRTEPSCSICNKKVDGPFGCEDGHVRGKEYDGALCFYIVDEMQYSEVSFVNKPADQSDSHAALVTGMKVVQVPGLTADARQAMEEAMTAIKNRDFATKGATISDEAQPVSKDITKMDDNCPECESKFWTDAEVAELKTLSDEYEAEIAKDEMGDAKLSAEARKNLKSTSFCGPDRSFPVPDCSHVTAARRLIGRAKVSDSTKAKILACVGRKAKSLGCGDSTDATADTLALLEETKNQLLEQVAALNNEKKAAEDQLKLANDKIEKMLADLQKAQDELKKVKEAVTAGEAQHKEDLGQQTALTQSLKEKVSSNITLMSLLLGKEAFLKAFSGSNAEERIKSFNTVISDSLKETLEDLMKKENDLLKELAKTTIVKPNMTGPLDVPEGDKVLAEKIKEHKTRKDDVLSWWQNG